MKNNQQITYICNGEDSKWTGIITIMDDTNVPALLEVDVGARASGFHIIIGKHQWGRFICVPSWQIGSELAELSDRSWNLERLCSDYPDLREVNVISIVDALRKLSKYYDL